MTNEKAIEAAALSIERIYPMQALIIAQKAIDAAMPFMLSMAWDNGFSKISGRPLEFDIWSQGFELEAAAQAIYSTHRTGNRWDLLDYQLRWTYRGDAELVLKAATPHWVEVREAFMDGANTANLKPQCDPRTLNPHRAAAIASHRIHSSDGN